MNEQKDIKAEALTHLIKRHFTAESGQIKDFLINAIASGDTNYLNQTLSRRSPGTPDQQGSVFLDVWDPIKLVKFILDHKVEEYIPESPWRPIEGRPDLPCRYFKMVIPGRLGIVNLTELPKGSMVEIRDDKNIVNTAGGSIQAHVKGKLGEFTELTTLIVGPMETDLSKYELFTIHPGEPIFGGKDIKREDLIGKSITVEEAMSTGLTHALVERDIKVYQLNKMTGPTFRKVFADNWYAEPADDRYMAVLFGPNGEVLNKYADLDRERALSMLLLSNA